MLIHTERIFADHYQFYIFDSAYNHFDNLDWNLNKKEKYGYISTDKGLYVLTVSDLNDHRLRIYKDEKPIISNYERFFEHQLTIDSGILVISTPINTDEDDIKITLDKGKYKIFICSNSIGKDLSSFKDNYDDELSDKEYNSYDIFEYYDLYITT